MDHGAHCEDKYQHSLQVHDNCVAGVAGVELGSTGRLISIRTKTLTART